MNKKQVKEQIKAIEDFGKKVRLSKTTAKKALVESGIYTPKGNLRKPYKRGE